MIATSTHDTKRGEDVSARLAVLSELPERWQQSVEKLHALTEPFRTRIDGAPAPTPSAEYLFYQTLLGAWPLGWDGNQGREQLRERMVAFMAKAGREAKQMTSWLRPHAAYEQAVQQFVEQAIESEAVRAELQALSTLISPYGASNGLAQTVLRLCSPGVSDTYQGAELWNQSLVDPDNRREVDFVGQRRTLSFLRERFGEKRKLASDLLADYQDGRIKLYVSHVLLKLRQTQRELFLRGDYEPLVHGEHMVAFTRSFEGQRLVCCVPRFSYLLSQGKAPFALGDVWKGEALTLPYPGRYRNVFTDETLQVDGKLALSAVFAHFPVAVLVREAEGA